MLCISLLWYSLWSIRHRQFFFFHTDLSYMGYFSSFLKISLFSFIHLKGTKILKYYIPPQWCQSDRHCPVTAIVIRMITAIRKQHLTNMKSCIIIKTFCEEIQILVSAISFYIVCAHFSCLDISLEALVYKTLKQMRHEDFQRLI